jgi:hypothetical protein
VKRPPRGKRKTRPSVAPKRAGDLLDGTFRWLNLDDSARSFRAMRAFSLAAGPRICEHARGERLRGAILYVRCDSSAWTQHLHVMKAQLLARIQKTAGGEGVAELRFNVGPLSEVVSWDAPQPTPPATPQPAHAPTEDFTRALAAIDDPELRDHLAKLYARLGTTRRT